MATRLVNTPTNILFPTTLDASKRAHSACRDGLELFSSSMYLFVTRCTEPTKLHVAGALHRLFLVHCSLTNQHCTLAATQDTDLVFFFFFFIHLPVCRWLWLFNLFLAFTLKHSGRHELYVSYIFFPPSCAHVIRVLCNVVNYVDWDMTMLRTLTRQQGVQLRNTWILSVAMELLFANRQRQAHCQCVCVVLIYVCTGMVMCQSAESSIVLNLSWISWILLLYFCCH